MRCEHKQQEPVVWYHAQNKNGPLADTPYWSVLTLHYHIILIWFCSNLLRARLPLHQQNRTIIGNFICNTHTVKTVLPLLLFYWCGATYWPFSWLVNSINLELITFNLWWFGQIKCSFTHLAWAGTKSNLSGQLSGLWCSEEKKVNAPPATHLSFYHNSSCNQQLCS